MSELAPTYFVTPAAFRAWLRRNAATATELVVGFHKVGSGTPSITWPEAVDEALCAGWIDSVRKRIDDERYQIRFTPRKPTGHWSAINIDRVAVLTAQGRMRPAGLAAFARRTEAKSRAASYEQPGVAALEPAGEEAFRRNKAARAFFESQAPSYRKTALWWVTSAKQPATRKRRLQKLIEASANGQRV